MTEKVTDFASEAMARSPEPPPPRRSKLKCYDMIPAQVLNPNGECATRNTTLSTQRRGIAISRRSEIHATMSEFTNLEATSNHEQTAETPISDEALAKLAKAMKKANIDVPSPNLRPMAGLWQADDEGGPMAEQTQQ
jgi:hypothetical protein